MNIAIDGNEANINNRVGSNVYAFELLSALYQLLKNRPEVNVTVLLSSPRATDLPKARINWKYEVITPVKLWTQWALPLHLFAHRRDYDVFFTPGHYAPRICPLPYISSVMDLAFLHYPQQFRKSDLLQLKNWTSYSVKKAAKVVTISEFSKKEIIKFYGKKAEEIVIAYPAIPSQVKSQKSKVKNFQNKVFQEFGLSQNYLLSVSTLQPRKNLIRLIEAFEELSVKVASNPTKIKKGRGKRSEFSKLNELQLVIAGKIGWLAAPIIDKIENSPFKEQIILTGFVSEAEKQVLYTNALVTVSVSPYEGFGIPALEACAFGSIPVVASNTSLPEVVGPAGILVDPNSVASITGGLEQALNLSAKQRAAYLKKGREQAKKFSWEKSAIKVLEAIEALLRRAADKAFGDARQGSEG